MGLRLARGTGGVMEARQRGDRADRSERVTRAERRETAADQGGR